MSLKHKRFSWGKVIEVFDYNFDGDVVYITKYHPWKEDSRGQLTKEWDTKQIMYNCEGISAHSSSMQVILLGWIAYNRSGLCEPSLVCGIARALRLKV
jgi:hypothetical protein